ncbi:MAG: NAD-dependent dihydropyrimidine dehydrogenase subunit PreA [Gemmatimonadota bacterium]
MRSPNPFWLASGPPTNTAGQVMRAFDRGWGGAVWKTLGDPITNTVSRYGGTAYQGRNVSGFNNIELITDRPLDVNLREIAEVKRRYPGHAVIASLMVGSRDEWKDIIRRTEDTGCDGFELNFGCPHGMCERGMGSAVGQEPRILAEITSWAVEFSSIPVLVKLTPNITDILEPGLAAQRGGAAGVSLINTIKSVISVDRDTLSPLPSVDGQGTSGGYCGPAVKPIALHMVTRLGKAPGFGLPISGIGGVQSWEDAVDFLLLGATSVQVCTAAMHYGFRIVEDMRRGLEEWMRSKGYARVEEFVGAALPQYEEWGDLNLNYKIIAQIDPSTCIGCQLCFAACEDGAHQCIDRPAGTRVPRVVEEECVGCNLCQLVCPVEGCISMVEIPTGLPRESWNERVAKGTAGAGSPH